MGRAIMLRHLLRLRSQRMPRQLLLGRAICGCPDIILQWDPDITGELAIGPHGPMREHTGWVQDTMDTATIRAIGADKILRREHFDAALFQPEQHDTVRGDLSRVCAGYLAAISVRPEIAGLAFAIDPHVGQVSGYFGGSRTTIKKADCVTTI